MRQFERTPRVLAEQLSLASGTNEYDTDPQIDWHSAASDWQLNRSVGILMHWHNPGAPGCVNRPTGRFGTCNPAPVPASRGRLESKPANNNMPATAMVPGRQDQRYEHDIASTGIFSNAK